ncbi:MAG TPA: sialidase family protein, partial [Gaiellaceae bacterium]|nr:sialidase family protein [Gaiellaceae bacterium]
MRTFLERPLRLFVLLVCAAGLALVPSALGSHAVGGADVKVTNDNSNVDGGMPNPGFDAQNRQSNEATVSISPASPSIVAAAANDYRMVTVTGDVWLGFYVSADQGATWFNTFVPGFPGDTSPAGLVSPLRVLDASGDPVVRFDGDGNLYVAGIAFNRNFDQPDRPVDNLVYVARYDFTPGSPGGVSTPTSAADPPNFTYAGTTVVDRGAVGFAVPGPFGFAGKFTDKEWMEIDTNTPGASPCAGNVYVAHTNFYGLAGTSPIVFSSSRDGAAAFAGPTKISTGGRAGTPYNQGADIAVAPDGTIFVAYGAFEPSSGLSSINLVKSRDCGRSWSKPVVVAPINDPQAPGVAFRTPAFAFVAA